MVTDLSLKTKQIWQPCKKDGMDQQEWRGLRKEGARRTQFFLAVLDTYVKPPIFMVRGDKN